MNKLIDFELPAIYKPKSAKQYAEEIRIYREYIRSKVCQKTRNECIEKFPIIAKLEENLEIFESYGYTKHFTEETFRN